MRDDTVASDGHVQEKGDWYASDSMLRDNASKSRKRVSSRIHSTSVKR